LLLTKVSVCSGTLGVDDTLGDTFAVEVGNLVDEVEVLEKDRTELTGSH